MTLFGPLPISLAPSPGSLYKPTPRGLWPQENATVDLVLLHLQGCGAFCKADIIPHPMGEGSYEGQPPDSSLWDLEVVSAHATHLARRRAPLALRSHCLRPPSAFSPYPTPAPTSMQGASSNLSIPHGHLRAGGPLRDWKKLMFQLRSGTHHLHASASHLRDRQRQCLPGQLEESGLSGVLAKPQTGSVLSAFFPRC